MVVEGLNQPRNTVKKTGRLSSRSEVRRSVQIDSLSGWVLVRNWSWVGPDSSDGKKLEQIWSVNGGSKTGSV